jgi:hypothetical protein
MEQNGATGVEEFVNLRIKSKTLETFTLGAHQSEVIEIPAQLAVNVP